MIFCLSNHHLAYLNNCMTRHPYQISSILLIHIANGYKLLPELRHPAYWSFGECQAVHFYNVSISSDKLHKQCFLTTNSRRCSLAIISAHYDDPYWQTGTATHSQPVMSLWWIRTPFFLLNREINAVMKQRPSCTKVKCRHQGVSCGQLQKTIAPRLTNWDSLFHSRPIWCHPVAPPGQLQSGFVLAHTWL